MEYIECGEREWEATVAFFENAFAKERTQENYRLLFDKLRCLGDCLYDKHDYSGAKAAYTRLIRLATECEREWDTRRDFSVGYDRLSDVARAKGASVFSEEYYWGATVGIEKLMAGETAKAEANRDMAIYYSKLGDDAAESGALALARDCYEKAFDLRVAVAKKTGTAESYDALASAYYSMSFTRNSGEMMNKAFCIWFELAARYPDVLDYARKRDLAGEALRQFA